MSEALAVGSDGLLGLDAERGVVLDGEHPVITVVLVPIEVDRDKRVVPFEADPGALSALLGWVLGHLLGPLEDGVDAVVVDRDAVPLTEDMGDCFGSLLVTLLEFEYPADEVSRVLGVGFPSWRLDPRKLACFAVFLGELLDATPPNVVPISDVLRVEVVINNEPTDPVHIILLQLHLVTTLEGLIVPTKSFPDCTGRAERPEQMCRPTPLYWVRPQSPRMYDCLADLPLRVKSLGVDRRERDTSSGFTRATSVLSLSGDGAVGRGEDVTYDLEEHDPEQWAGLDLSLAGEYTLDSFSTALDGLDLFPDPLDREDFRHYRRWALESAALDLALRQAGTTLGERLDRSCDPVRFVASARLSRVDSDEPPAADRVHRLLDVHPDLGFKLDPTPEWTADLVADLARTGAVRILDLKGHYSGTEVETPPDPDLYKRLVEAFPESIVEDPALTEATRPLFDGHEARVAWDQPITGVDSVEALPFEPSWLNVKPSRFGTVQSLLDTIEYCDRRGIEMYGGGQFELDVGRRQIQTLASLCYPDGPNDVAPMAYNDPDPGRDLPGSPLPAPDPEVGFS